MKKEISINVGAFGILTVLSVALKLAGVIPWSWVYVLVPLWLPLMIGVLAWCIVVVIGAITEMEDEE